MRLLMRGVGVAILTVSGAVAGFSELGATERMALLMIAALLAGGLAVTETIARREASSAPRKSRERRPALPEPLVRSDLFQLPTDIDDFIGREHDLANVMTQLESKLKNAVAVGVVTIVGKPGVGKTTLAIHAAHQLRHLYPDGQLYVNLRGAEAQVLDPREVLAGFLRELGVARAAVPESTEERARLFRARLDGQRILIVLDNAANEAQIRPLLPGSPTNSVIITARSAIAGITAAHVELEEFTPEQALSLLQRILGEESVNTDLSAGRAICDLCGQLPLAVRIAGSRLLSKHHWNLSGYVQRLADERHRLDELSAGDQAVRASFAVSYEELTPPERRLFRLLGLLEGPDFPAWVAAALLQEDLDKTETVLERLVDLHLLTADQAGGPQTRYRFHDLLRVFARECLQAAEDPEAQRRSLESLLRAYVCVTERAYAIVEPGELTDEESLSADWWPGNRPESITELLREPERWFAVERPNLVAALLQAQSAHFPELTCRLAIALYGAFNVGAHWHVWQVVYRNALEAARLMQDRRAEAGVMLRLGDVFKNSGRVDGPGGIAGPDREDVIAADWLERSRALFQSLGDMRGEAVVLRRLGGVYRDLGRLDDARRCYEEGLAISEKLPDPDLIRAYILRGLGALLRMTHAYDEAVRAFQEALVTFRAHGVVRGELGALRGLGETYLLLERWDDAEACFQRHLAVDREWHDRHAEAHSLKGIGEVRLGQGDWRSAVVHFQAALPLFQEIGHRVSEAETLDSLGRAYLVGGHARAAREDWGRAASIYDGLGLDQADRIRERIRRSRPFPLIRRLLALRADRTGDRGGGTGDRADRAA
jgi:tetratricopeptide (TPR) repeat protein